MARVKQRTDQAEALDALVVGAGFAGLHMLYRLRGLGLRARVFEAASGVGGTWYWNRYPGARCDVDSLEYSYQFSEELQQEWEWTERYATQPEILRYANYVADRFDLRRDIVFDTGVESAIFDEEAARWMISTSDGARVSARFCVMATGCLSSANTPDFEGLERFRGAIYHTGRWPHEGVDFTGQRVGVIGTGSSAIQSIPLIAQEARHLFVFQRTPNYSVPAHNALLDPAEKQKIKADYPAFRERNAEMVSGFGSRYKRPEQSAVQATPEERQAVYEKCWAIGGLPFMGAYIDLLADSAANDTAGEFIRGKIRETVNDPATAELLSPKHVVGCKRLCVDTGYYETYNRENMSLVDVSRAPIEQITESGVRTGGREYPLDCIVLATGFDAMTGALLRIDIRGRAGQPLQDKWAAGPRTYLGLQTVGFPNLFTITGPGSPSVLSNMIPSIEQHVNWIADCIAWLGEQGVVTIEPTAQAEDAWVEHVNEVAGATLFPTCNSWYLGANVPGKPRVFMPYLGFPAYVEKCKDVVSRGYEGFALGRQNGAPA